MRTWEDNAAEFGALSKQGRDVRLALLVATSVEKGAANGRPRKTSANTEVSEKVSAERFGREAGTTGDRVLRHLDAWNRAAEKGLCAPSADLTPEDANDADMLVPSEDDFAASFTVPDNAGGRTMGNIKTAVDTVEKRGAEKFVQALTPEMKTRLVTEVIKQADPITLHDVQRVVDKTPPAAVTDLSKQYQEAQQRAKDESKERHSERYLSIDVTLSKVRRLIAEARAEASGVTFSNWEREDLTETVARIIGDARLLNVILTGESGADWNAGLAELTEGR